MLFSSSVRRRNAILSLLDLHASFFFYIKRTFGERSAGINLGSGRNSLEPRFMGKDNVFFVFRVLYSQQPTFKKIVSCLLVYVYKTHVWKFSSNIALIGGVLFISEYRINSILVYKLLVDLCIWAPYARCPTHTFCTSANFDCTQQEVNIFGIW